MKPNTCPRKAMKTVTESEYAQHFLQGITPGYKCPDIKRSIVKTSGQKIESFIVDPTHTESLPHGNQRHEWRNQRHE